MTQSDKARQWMAENTKAFDCWNRHVEEHGLPLAEFNQLGQDPDDQSTYEPDEGPLTEAELNQIRAQAAPKLGKGPVLRRRSLLEDSDD